MKDTAESQIDYEAATREWDRSVPWWRRQSVRLGIQGKLFLGFLFLLAVTMVGTYWLFISENRHVLSNIMGENAVELSHAIAMASEPLMTRGDHASLERIGRDLLRNRDIVAVCFYDPEGRPLVHVSQDPEHDADPPPPVGDNLSKLLQVRHRRTRTLGEYAEVTVPVLHLPSPRAAHSGDIAGEGVTVPRSQSRLVGYVTVAASTAATGQLINRITLLLLILGGLVFLISMPIVYAMVNRILLPIRQLVVATMRIAAGDLEAKVEVHRPDLIGTLARSFNEMVCRVKQQQRQLADANLQLAEANIQLAEANRDLEAKVQQRTAQLETIAQQLASANTRLSAEIAEKEDFLRAVSHDLNAPLRNIAGMATMLLLKYRDKLDQDILHRLDRIQKNVEIESELIAELLELSRIKTRRQKMEHVDIEAMVRELAEMFENDLKTSGIELIIETRLPVLNCERARLRQVFQNLIDNAIKYMGNKPVKQIRIGCDVRPSEAEFYVRDTGIGIDPEDQQKVFYVFRRGKNEAVQHVSGKGVGLASVKSIIETYSGTIWVESTPGEGSCFRFTINGQYVPQSISMSTAQPTPSSAGGYSV